MSIYYVGTYNTIITKQLLIVWRVYSQNEERYEFRYEQYLFLNTQSFKVSNK